MDNEHAFRRRSSFKLMPTCLESCPLAVLPKTDTRDPSDVHVWGKESNKKNALRKRDRNTATIGTSSIHISAGRYVSERKCVRALVREIVECICPRNDNQLSLTLVNPSVVGTKVIK